MLNTESGFFSTYTFHPFKSVPLPDAATEEFQGDILPVLKCAARGATPLVYLNQKGFVEGTPPKINIDTENEGFGKCISGFKYVYFGYLC